MKNYNLDPPQGGPRGFTPNVNLGHAVPVSATSFNNAQRQLLMSSMRNRTAAEGPDMSFFSNANLPGLLDQADAADNMHNQANFLQVMGQMTVGRGVNKQHMTPAMQDGVMAKIPALFGVQAKQPIPYQKIVANSNNLAQIARGYQESAGALREVPSDVSTVIANVNRRGRVIDEAFNKQASDSLYSDMTRTPDVNLYKIKIRNSRRDDLFSIL